MAVASLEAAKRLVPNSPSPWAQGVLDLENLVSVPLGRSLASTAEDPPRIPACHIEALRVAENGQVSFSGSRKCWFLGLQNELILSSKVDLFSSFKL